MPESRKVWQTGSSEMPPPFWNVLPQGTSLLPTIISGNRLSLAVADTAILLSIMPKARYLRFCDVRSILPERLSFELNEWKKQDRLSANIFNTIFVCVNKRIVRNCLRNWQLRTGLRLYRSAIMHSGNIRQNLRLAVTVRLNAPKSNYNFEKNKTGKLIFVLSIII